MNIKKILMRDRIGQEGLLDLITELGETTGKTMVEIGTFTGESTVIFADHFKEVIGIDPMLPEYDKQDPTSKFDFNEVLKMFLLRTENYNNISLIQKTSDDAVNDFKDASIDFVYIDGIHQYPNVLSDIKNYLPKIKKGGIIGGHDYGQHWPGVKQAVDEMFGEPDKTFSDGSWIKFL